MIFCAVAGPTPSSVSSCSAVALLRLIGGPGAAPDAPAPPPGTGTAAAPPRAPACHRTRRRAAARARRHHDLLAVGDLRREVDRVDVCARARAARALDCV